MSAMFRNPGFDKSMSPMFLNDVYKMPMPGSQVFKAGVFFQAEVLDGTVGTWAPRPGSRGPKKNLAMENAQVPRLAEPLRIFGHLAREYSYSYSML